MNLTVVGPRVIIRPAPLPDMTEDGLLHLVHVDAKATVVGTVLALGDGPVSAKGKTLAHYVSVGDRVLFSPHAGQELFFEKEVLVCVDEDDILAVID